MCFNVVCYSRMVFQISAVFKNCKICNFLHLSTPCLKTTAKCAKCGRDWHPIRRAPSSGRKTSKLRRRSRPKLLDDDTKKRDHIDSAGTEELTDRRPMIPLIPQVQSITQITPPADDEPPGWCFYFKFK